MTASDATADELAIRNVLARAAHITDGRGTLDEYVQLWTDDCVWSAPHAGTWHGHDGQRARHERFRSAGVQGPGAESYHLLTTVWVDVKGDAADALSTWILITRWEGSPKVVDLGNYIDTFRRTDNGWQIATREVTQGDGAWLREMEANAPSD